MSMDAVIPYFVDRCKALGYVEHEDALNWENIPLTKVERAFHIELGDITKTKTDMWLLTIEVPVTVRLFVKAGRDTKAARTKAIADVKKLIVECMNPVKLGASQVKGVYFESTSIAAIDDSNDNILMTENKFTALTMLDVQGA